MYGTFCHLSVRSGIKQTTVHMWFSVYIGGVEFVDGACVADFQPGFPSISPAPKRTSLRTRAEALRQSHRCYCAESIFAAQAVLNSDLLPGLSVTDACLMVGPDLNGADHAPRSSMTS